MLIGARSLSRSIGILLMHGLGFRVDGRQTFRNCRGRMTRESGATGSSSFEGTTFLLRFRSDWEASTRLVIFTLKNHSSCCWSTVKFLGAMFAIWTFLGLTAAALIRLRSTQPKLPRPFHVWGYPWTPLT